MCVVSMVIDHTLEKGNNPLDPWILTPNNLEFLNELLRRAAEYDKLNNQKECETKEKKEQLVKLADEFDVQIKWPEV